MSNPGGVDGHTLSRGRRTHRHWQGFSGTAEADPCVACGARPPARAGRRAPRYHISLLITVHQRETVQTPPAPPPAAGRAASCVDEVALRPTVTVATGTSRPFHTPRTGARCLEWLLRPENGCLSRLLSTPHAPRPHTPVGCAVSADGGRGPRGIRDGHLVRWNTPHAQPCKGRSAQGRVLFAAAGRVHSCSTLHPHDYRPGGYLQVCPLRVHGRGSAHRPLSTPPHRRDLCVFCKPCMFCKRYCKYTPCQTHQPNRQAAQQAVHDRLCTRGGPSTCDMGRPAATHTVLHTQGIWVCGWVGACVGGWVHMGPSNPTRALTHAHTHGRTYTHT